MSQLNPDFILSPSSKLALFCCVSMSASTNFIFLYIFSFTFSFKREKQKIDKKRKKRKNGTAKRRLSEEFDRQSRSGRVVITDVEIFLFSCSFCWTGARNFKENLYSMICPLNYHLKNNSSIFFI